MKKRCNHTLTLRKTLLHSVISCAMAVSASAWADKSSDTLIYASDSEPENVSPYHNNLREGVILSHMAWDTLIFRDPQTSEYLPLLATSWEWQDSTNLVFKLRQGVTFHNGDSFSADDVVFTFNYVVSPESKIVTRKNVDWIDHAEKLDDYTVRLVLKKPFPAALEYLSGPTPIYPSEYFQKVGIEGYSKAPIGTGPYKITKVLSGEGVNLERYDDYFEASPIPKPAISKLQFRVIPDPDARLAQLMTGDIDWIWRVPSDQADQMKMMPGLDIKSAETMRIGYLRMETTSETLKDSPFNNQLVREAVNYAIDRDAFSQDLVRGGSRSVYTPCFPSQFGCDVSAAKKYEYNVEKAKALLAEAGYPDGFETEFYAYRERDLAEAMMGYLSEVGIKANLHFMKYAALRTDQRAGKVPLSFQTWGSYSVNDASAITSVFFKGGVDDSAKDETVIKLLDTADSSVDPDTRKKAYSAAIKRISEEAFWAPMFSYSSNYAFSDTLNFTPYPDELPRFYESSWK
ncbi:ABC transporter substrate-binding protein [Marinomonas mediterranea]|uniref:ABC-type transporter, periplasmic subunit n=1 Tax=Marinomonas mediterranea (strain ATCC 700492 / JCM 21426 / NBRC 103028 / MMB-1) TaxID=717774 RepID=F2K327_MARM1|nr:ABC transporter substrate-binding protein [Marinomonas mediterranea]ADZ90080.1 ABC-type transporter, periplasmic subunit [Marinomonas mediterranea MMB-1]WCN16285.1 ABC transporter substrate-binding protein [Marinomonas mediterranea MMB-1]